MAPELARLAVSVLVEVALFRPSRSLRLFCWRTARLPVERLQGASGLLEVAAVALRASVAPERPTLSEGLDVPAPIFHGASRERELVVAESICGERPGEARLRDVVGSVERPRLELRRERLRLSEELDRLALNERLVVVERESVLVLVLGRTIWRLTPRVRLLEPVSELPLRSELDCRSLDVVEGR